MPNLLLTADPVIFHLEAKPEVNAEVKLEPEVKAEVKLEVKPELSREEFVKLNLKEEPPVCQCFPDPRREFCR